MAKQVQYTNPFITLFPFKFRRVIVLAMVNAFGSFQPSRFLLYNRVRIAIVVAW